MPQRKPSTLWFGLLIALILSGLGLQAEPSRDEALEKGLYVVRAGDTLEGITERYLGSSIRWRENWKLNPDLQDPHMIRPGRRLQILFPKNAIVGGAILTKVSRQVDEQPAPFPWTDAQKWDLLKPRDSVRTHERSSAELMLGDERLVLTEDSLVILGGNREAPAIPTPGSVEVLVGQVDLEAPAVADASGQVEIFLGSVSMQPKRGSTEDSWARARKVEAGGAQLMVFGGESEVSAGGENVTVKRGMGTSVAEEGIPTPPEALLPAPIPLQPEAGSSWAAGNPLFKWVEVEGAVSYVLEVCGDSHCGQIEDRVVGITAFEWRPDGLPAGSFYWRLTAVAPSGLDGFPSPATEFTISSSAGDSLPPMVSVVIGGPGMGMGKRWVAGPGFELSAEVSDDGSGLERWFAEIDGQQMTPGTLPESWERGDHSVVIVAIDRAGNEKRSEKRSFLYDPQPPEISWGWSKDSILESARGERLAPDSSEDLRAPSELLWSDSGGRWKMLGDRSWTIRSDTPGFWIRPKRGSLYLTGIDEPITKDRALAIRALDEDCGVRKLTFALEKRIAEWGQEVVFLVVDATDNVGNTSRIEWLASSRPH